MIVRFRWSRPNSGPIANASLRRMWQISSHFYQRNLCLLASHEVARDLPRSFIRSIVQKKMLDDSVESSYLLMEKNLDRGKFGVDVLETFLMLEQGSQVVEDVGPRSIRSTGELTLDDPFERFLKRVIHRLSERIVVRIESMTGDGPIDDRIRFRLHYRNPTAVSVWSTRSQSSSGALQ